MLAGIARPGQPALEVEQGLDRVVTPALQAVFDGGQRSPEVAGPAQQIGQQREVAAALAGDLFSIAEGEAQVPGGGQAVLARR